MNEFETVSAVNNFFNTNLRWVQDYKLWKKKDYWATPLETVLKGAGDCEDYSIAKYFTLIQSGIDDEKLRLVYVKNKHNNAHMILTYTHNNKTYVLDNNEKDIFYFHNRLDLTPVYSFNLRGFWITTRTTSERIGGPGRLKLWVDLLNRMKIKLGEG